MTWYGTGLTDTGCIRHSNQDAFCVRNNLGLWIVADGMGSHPHSHLASETAVQAIPTFFDITTDQTIHGHLRTILSEAIRHAHDAIRQQCRTQPEFTGIGTTVVVAFMPDQGSNHLYIAHAGDSRAYLFRDSTLTLLTRDHTLLEKHIREGLLPKDTPSSHQLGHVLTKAVGIDSDIDPECTNLALQSTDRILLCSDGLNKMLCDETIQEILVSAKRDTNRDPCQDLVEEANRLGGYDNITVVVIENVRQANTTDAIV